MQGVSERLEVKTARKKCLITKRTFRVSRVGVEISVISDESPRNYARSALTKRRRPTARTHARSNL